jgi:hypothetical protein
VRRQAGQHVVRILPHGLGNNQRRQRVDAFENLHAFALRGDKSVADIFFVRMGSRDLVAGGGDSFGELLFHLLLGWPTLLIGRQTQVAAGDELDLFLGGWHGMIAFPGYQSPPVAIRNQLCEPQAGHCNASAAR